MSKPKVKVLGERVLVKEIEASNKSSGGIFLPGGAGKEAAHIQAKIIGVGDLNNLSKFGIKVENDGVKIGDVVIFDPGVGIPVNIEGNKYFIVEEKKLLAIVE